MKEGLSLVEVELLTGRHHQIRVQLKEHIGGIWGDTKYNGDAEASCINSGEDVDNSSVKKKSVWKETALFSYHLEFLHPKTKKKMVFEEMPEKEPFLSFDRTS